MPCYRDGGCGPYEYSACSECPASKPEYARGKSLMAPMMHNLKTLPEYFEAQLQGTKPFEVRRNDRDYRAGDTLHLQEWEPINGYTGRTLDKQITYILDDPAYCKEGYVILGVAAPVINGQWIHTDEHLWCKDDDGSIDMFALDHEYHNGPMCQICREAFCEHCTPNWENDKCREGHYYCSNCQEVSIDAHEHSCPNCGAKMDGGRR